jgi:glycosyltransferase involved in cell wall biosynthesis
VRVLLATVTDPSASARADLAALLASLAPQQAEIDLVLVLRGGGAPPASAAPLLRIHAVEAPLATGLSAARNRALAHARRHGLLDAADVVAFPDDDCAYPDGLLARVGALLVRETEIVCGAYAPQPEAIDGRRFPPDARPLSAQLAMQVVSSNNVFFAARVVAAVGDFDERFGLGAAYGASEDSDYVLRALQLGVRGAYAPADVFVVHPYKPQLAAKYYAGTLAVLAKHARRSAAVRRLLVRRVGFGAGLVLRRELAAGAYARALRDAGQLL